MYAKHLDLVIGDLRALPKKIVTPTRQLRPRPDLVEARFPALIHEDWPDQRR
jgi:hypothetical protein